MGCCRVSLMSWGSALGSLVERHLQRGPVRHRGFGDRRTQLDDLLRDGAVVGFVQPRLGFEPDAIQVVLVAADQLDQDRFFGLEVVIQASGENACRVGDFLQ